MRKKNQNLTDEQAASDEHSIVLIPKDGMEKICKRVNFDGKGNFFNCLNNWAITKTFKSRINHGKDKQIGGSIVYDPNTKDLFYAYSGSSFYRNENFTESSLKQLKAPDDIKEPIKTMLGNWHRNKKEIVKANFQRKLSKVGDFSFCDLSANDLALTHLASGGFGLVFLGTVKQSLNNCTAGLYIAEQAGYKISVDTIQPKKKSSLGEEVAVVIASHPKIHDEVKIAYLENLSLFDKNFKSHLLDAVNAHHTTGVVNSI